MDTFANMRLRAVEPSDIDFLYRIENIPEVWSVSWGDAPVSRQMLWEYVNNYTADIYTDRQLRLIIDIDDTSAVERAGDGPHSQSDGTAVGTVDITDYNPRHARAMLGVALLPEWRGRGIATEAVRRVIERCRDTLAMHQLAVMVPRDNEASMRLFTALGFKTAGCLRSWLRRGASYTDVILLQLMLQAR